MVLSRPISRSAKRNFIAQQACVGQYWWLPCGPQRRCLQFWGCRHPTAIHLVLCKHFPTWPFFRPTWDPHDAATWRTFVESLHSKETAHPPALPLKHCSFQYPTSRAIGCNLAWKEHPFSLQEWSFHHLSVNGAPAPKVCLSLWRSISCLRGATLRHRKKRTSSDHPKSWEGRADVPLSQELRWYALNRPRSL